MNLCGNCDSERLSNLPKVTQPVSGSIRGFYKASQFMFRVNTLLTTSLSAGKYDGSLSVFLIVFISSLVTSDSSTTPEFLR